MNGESAWKYENCQNRTFWKKLPFFPKLLGIIFDTCFCSVLAFQLIKCVYLILIRSVWSRIADLRRMSKASKFHEDQNFIKKTSDKIPWTRKRILGCLLKVVHYHVAYLSLERGTVVRQCQVKLISSRRLVYFVDE